MRSSCTVRAWEPPSTSTTRKRHDNHRVMRFALVQKFEVLLAHVPRSLTVVTSAQLPDGFTKDNKFSDAKLLVAQPFFQLYPPRHSASANASLQHLECSRPFFFASFLARLHRRTRECRGGLRPKRN